MLSQNNQTLLNVHTKPNDLNCSSIENLVIEGGGLKNLAVLGSLHSLESKGLLDNINKYAGTSSGSIIILLLSIGYKPKEIFDKIFSISVKFDNFFTAIYNFTKAYGLNSSSDSISFLKPMLKNKNFSEDITFGELYSITKKEIVITGTCLNERDTYYFSHNTLPQMKVIDAISISISIPLIFKSVLFEGKRFVDGGVLSNFPLYYFDLPSDPKPYQTLSEIIQCPRKKMNLMCDKYSNKTLGFITLNINENKDPKIFQGFDKISSFQDFVFSLVSSVSTKLQSDNLRLQDPYWYRTFSVKLPFYINTANFQLSDDQKNILFKTGYIQMEEHLLE